MHPFGLFIPGVVREAGERCPSVPRERSGRVPAAAAAERCPCWDL